MRQASIQHTACAAIAFVLIAIPADAKHKPAPPPAPLHNFVNLDLTAFDATPPRPPHLRMSITLLDAATAARRDDTVDFDILTIFKSFGHYMSGTTEIGPPEGTVVNTLSHYQASCTWRTVHTASIGPNYFGAGKSFGGGITPQAMQPVFLSARSAFLVAIDRLCEGLPLNAAKGYSGVDTAVAALAGAFGPPVPSVVMRPVPPVAPSPTPAGTMDGQHRFVRIETDPATGNTRFLDRGNLVHDGQRVAAAVFVLLGPQAQYWNRNGAGVAALQSVRIDCTAHTLTVTSQAQWDRLGGLTGNDGMAFAPRSVGVRPQIDAACTDPAPADAQSFASTDDAWDFVRASWPPAPLPGWLACIWVHEPDARRAAFLAQATPGSFAHYLVPRAEADAEAAACAIPPAYNDTVFDHMTAYAGSRAGLQQFAAHGIDEDKLRAAWAALPAADRRRMLRAETSFGSDAAFAQDMYDRLVSALRLSPGYNETRRLLQSYFTDMAFVEAG